MTENIISELNELRTRMGLCSFVKREVAFLKEFCSIMKPIVRGLDILQGEDSYFYETLLPMLKTIIKKTKALILQLFSATVGMVDAIENSIK